MPANVVHSKTDEARWEAAKALARRSKKGSGSIWPLVMHIFQNEKQAGKVAHVDKAVDKSASTTYVIFRGHVLEKSEFERLTNRTPTGTPSDTPCPSPLLSKGTGPRGFKVRPLGDSLSSQRGLQLQQYSRNLRPHHSSLGKPAPATTGRKPKLPAAPKIPMPRQLAGIVKSFGYHPAFGVIPIPTEGDE